MRLVNAGILLIAIIGIAAGAVMLLVGRRHRMNRAATDQKRTFSIVEVLGTAVLAAGVLSLTRAF